MRGVERQDIHIGARQFDGAFEEIAGGADRGAHAQAAMFVFCGARIFQFFLNVFDGDQALEVEVLIDDQQFFDAVLLQQALGFFERGAHRNGDQIVFGHHAADGLIEIFLEAQIAIGEDAHQLGAARYRQARDAVLVHEFERMTHRMFRRNGHRIDDHSAFGALDAVHFFGLALDGHVAVNEAEAALARHGDGQVRFGDRVHGR